jgi:hypothetical protein
VRDFFGQWLGFRALEGPLPANASPDLSARGQSSMGEEARLFVSALVASDHGIGDLMTADVNFVDSWLANLYGFPFASPAFTFVEVMNTTDKREGFLGLSAFLEQTSPADHTSPVHRGLWVLERLLCRDVPPPPIDQPPPPSTGTALKQSNDRLANPMCASCHSIVDPVGLGLEGFDQLGRARTVYPTTEQVDEHGSLDGTPYIGVIGLAGLVAKDPRFPACARDHLLAYALGRTPTTTDAARVGAIDQAWSATGRSVRGLLAALVVDELFRYRRGEGP